MKPFGGFFVIFLDSVSVSIDLPKIILSDHVSLFCRKGVPFDSFGIILFDIPAIGIEVSQVYLIVLVAFFWPLTGLF